MARCKLLDLKLLLTLLPFVLWSLFGWPYIRGHNADESSSDIVMEGAVHTTETESQALSLSVGHETSLRFQRRSSDVFSVLDGLCIDYLVICDILSCTRGTDTLHLGWSYMFCHRKFIKRMRVKKIAELNDALLINTSDREIIGTFDRAEGNDDLYVDSDGTKISVSMKCCSISSDNGEFTRNISIQFPYADIPYRMNQISVSIRDSVPALAAIDRVDNASDGRDLHLTVCMPSLCKEPEVSPKRLGRQERRNWRLARRQAAMKRINNAGAVPSVLDNLSQQNLLDRVRKVFTHAYDSYMEHAYPAAELRPLSCVGGRFELVQIPLVTLIDSMDTLIIMGNRTEFSRAVNIVINSLPNFNLDVNVSLFETTIRILGGLLSAHLFAIDATLQERLPDESSIPFEYDGKSLLSLAIDLGHRLLPAFDTKTKIPFGTVNLMYGVPEGETKVASTAGAGSLLIEFEVLSRLSGDESFGRAALLSMKSIYKRRSSVGLVGKHINTETGAWHESISGIGSNSDSYYEYMLKGHLLFRRKELYRMFSDSYMSIKKFVLMEDHWFTEVDMFTGRLQRKRVENLDAFWPGMEAMLGFAQEGAEQLNAFYAVWESMGFLPEEFDYSQWLQGNEMSSSFYPLRPELIESTYHQYRATGDRTWLSAGKLFLESIENISRTECGFASISSNNRQHQLQDQMPSFFLSETCKYLFLLFDEHNFIHARPYIFSTEAHPYDAVQLHLITQPNTPRNDHSFSTTKKKAGSSILKEVGKQRSSSRKPSKMDLPAISSSAVARNKVPEKGLAKDGENLLDKLLRVVDLHKERQKQLELKRQHVEERDNEQLSSHPDTKSSSSSEESSLLPLKCPKRSTWSSDYSYQPNYFKKNIPSNIRTTRKRVLNTITLLAHVYKHLQVPKTTTETQEVSGAAIPRHPYSIYSARTDVCPSSDQPSKKGSDSTIKSATTALIDAANKAAALAAAAAASAASEAGLKRTVAVNMGSLGEFEVKVFSDGFVVNSKQDLSTVEISNIGKNVVMVRDSGPGENKHAVQTVVATTSGYVRTCKVQVVTATPDFFTETVVWERSCSLANFGPSATAHLQSSVFIPQFDNELMCRLPEPSSWTNGRADAADDKLSPEPTKRKWWQWASYHPEPAKSEQEHDREETGDESKGGEDVLRGSIVLARRGDCLFEEKATLAQRLGAAALVIRNTEENVFIMAGKREVDAAASASPSIPGALGKLLARSSDIQAKVKDEDTVHLPTVMVTRTDGDELAKFFNQPRPVSTPSLQMRLSIASDSTIFNSEFFGNFDYPKVWVSKTVVYVLGRSNWGTFMTSTSTSTTSDDSGTGDWQLYLMGKKDMDNPQMLPLVDMAGPYSNQPKTLLSSVVSNPVEMYRYVISRRCPHVFQARGMGDGGARYRLRSKRQHSTSSRHMKQPQET